VPFISPLVSKSEIKSKISIIMSFELLKYSLNAKITLRDPKGFPIEITARKTSRNKRSWARGGKSLSHLQYQSNSLAGFVLGSARFRKCSMLTPAVL